MSDIVIIPTFDRPEYLWACLENIYKNVRGALSAKLYYICEDIHADKPKNFTTEIEMLATIREWQRKFGFAFSYNVTPPHTTYGNNYNVLSALQRAAMFCGQLDKVYLIEDDVLITPDFFEWNDMVFDQYNVRIACAGRLNRSMNFHINGPDAMDESIKDVNAVKRVLGAYNSWATCFSREAMRMFTSLNTDFSEFRPGFEQDIWIQNILSREKISTIWPYVPRAYHMGWYSYHRNTGMQFNGTLEQKVKALQKAVTDQKKIREMAGAQEIDAFPKVPHEAATRLYAR